MPTATADYRPRVNGGLLRPKRPSQWPTLRVPPRSAVHRTEAQNAPRLELRFHWHLPPVSRASLAAEHGLHCPKPRYGSRQIKGGDGGGGVLKFERSEAPLHRRSRLRSVPLVCTALEAAARPGRLWYRECPGRHSAPTEVDERVALERPADWPHLQTKHVHVEHRRRGRDDRARTCQCTYLLQKRKCELGSGGPAPWQHRRGQGRCKRLPVRLRGPMLANSVRAGMCWGRGRGGV